MDMKKECPGCGGSGQISFFQGVSRFLLTREECPYCLGTGLVDDEQDQADKRDCPRDGGSRKRR